MIIKNGQKIKKYLFIDHMGDGFGYTEAGKDEEIIGCIAFRGDHSEAFILHRRISDGVTLQTVNPHDIAQIIFDV